LNRIDTFIWGLMGALGINGSVFLLALAVLSLNHYKSVALYLSLLFFSVTQLLYLGPSCFFAVRTGCLALAKGIGTAMAVTALLNGGCLLVGLWILPSVAR